MDARALRGAYNRRVKAEDFVHLHCHSTYSLLEALPTPEEIVARAKELGQTSVALTDRGYTYGLMEFYKAAKEAGVKPILGVEVFVAARTRNDRESGVDNRSAPLVLLAESDEGYQNLLQLCTRAALEGMYYKPRVDDELLSLYGKGLIALTGPISGQIPQACLMEDGKRIEELTEKYRSWFGKENVYFELLDFPNLEGQREINQQLISWGKKLGVPLVAGGNSYYCRPEDSEAHDVLLCIQKNANIADPGRFSMQGSDYSIRSSEDLMQTFADHPEALENTRIIAERCNLHPQFDKYHIPRFPVPKGRTEEEELTRLAEEGFRKRYEKITPEMQQRLEYELSVIKQVGFSGYFLIVADFVREAKARGITVGPGRGSAAGSLVSYSLGITNVDPLAYGLIFERFLNPERISMPDIDLDFADTRRDEILEYVRGKYGNDHVVQICTFGTLAARAAVKDVGRVYGIPFLEMNTLAKLIPDKPGTTLDEALQTTELKTVYQTNETYKKIIDTALKLEGKARHVSVHACGVIITEEPATHYTALQKAPKDDETIITQYGAKPLEALGLLKMDFLGLMNLTVIQTTLEIIRRTRGEDINIEKIPLDNKRTYQLLQRGDTTGVFQLESAGMRRYLKELKPTVFEDITAMVALYRPGPMDLLPSFVKRKSGKEEITYLHPMLKPILENTYGVGVYQEQMMQIARDLAGFSLPDADMLRKAIGKKIKSLLDEQKEKLVAGMIKNGIPKKIAEEIWELFPPFARYGFNKSHAVGYARIAYETAYLKANYPAEFMAALLSAEASDAERVMIEIEECRAMGIPVLPPDINESRSQFTTIQPAEGDTTWAIRFGLAAIKGVGESSVRVMLDERDQHGPFLSIEDFARRLPQKTLNKKLLESLAKSGALDSLGERRMLVEQYDKIADYSKASGDVGGAQTDLFGGGNHGMEESAIEFQKNPPATPQQKLQWEKETLGLYVSSHPLAGLTPYIRRKASLIASLEAKNAGKKIVIAGIQEGIKKMTTKKGEAMAVITLEDPTGKMEVTLFPKTYAECASMIELPDTVLVIGGTLDLRAGALQVRADAVKRSSLSGMIARAKEDGTFDQEEAKRGVSVARKPLLDDAIEAVDEEGNVIAGETVRVDEQAGTVVDGLGPLGQWLAAGMKMEDAMNALGLTAEAPVKTEEKPGTAPRISIETIVLPERAPKQMLLELKHTFEMFPGSQRIQLKIGEQLVPLPLTVTMSPILERKVDEILQRYAAVH